MYAGTSGFAFLQNQQDGAQPIALSNSLDKSCEFFGDLGIPSFYNKSEINSMLAGGGSTDLSNYYTKPQVEALISNLNLSYYYTKTEVGSPLSDYSTITYLQDNYMTSLSITQTLMNNYASVTFIVDNFYDKTYLDNQFSLKADLSELTNLVTTEYLTTKYTNSVDLTTVYYNKTETDNMLNQKVNTSGNSSIQGRLDAYLFRCGEIRIKNDVDLNCLSLIQLTATYSKRVYN